MIVIPVHHRTLAMSMAAMPHLRMQSQTTTLDSLNQTSKPPTCEVVEAADEDRHAISCALAVVLLIANQSPNSYLSLVNWKSQKPSCEIVEIAGSGRKPDVQKSKSRWRQLVERIVAFVASTPPIVCMIYLFREECRKVKELQDKCIAIEQNAILRSTWWKIWNTCQDAAHSIRYYQLRDKPDKQRDCEEALELHWQTCKMFLESAKEECEIIERMHRRECFRPHLIHILKILKEHYHPD